MTCAFNGYTCALHSANGAFIIFWYAERDLFISIDVIIFINLHYFTSWWLWISAKKRENNPIQNRTAAREADTIHKHHEGNTLKSKEHSYNVVSRRHDWELWNNIPADIKQTKSLNIFKRSVKQLIMNLTLWISIYYNCVKVDWFLTGNIFSSSTLLVHAILNQSSKVFLYQ